MPTPRKDQKQIAQRYAGNLRYFRKLNPFRRSRILLMLGCLLLAVVLALIYIQSIKTSRRAQLFSSSGGISREHFRFGQDCQKCHDPAVKIDLQNPAVMNASLDAKCEACHTRHTFHQVEVVENLSCLDCHHEHLGTGPMQPVADSNCLSCHGNAAVMAASAQKGLQFRAGDFHVKSKNDLLVYFQPPRPAMGYTQVFQSFEKDHPDFQIQRENLTDPNTLKFNHKSHLTGKDIPLVDGHKLDCAYCHQPDSQGAYMQPISFAKNCQACHVLQIDPTLPDFQIPHPTSVSEANSVRDFILTLPTQYATYAADKMGMKDATQVAAFVSDHMSAIRQRTREGTDLIQEVFYTDKRKINPGDGTPPAAGERALFPGCAHCHEVKTSAANEPVVTPPVLPDRWYVHAEFSHATHSTMKCEDCHGQVLQSVKSSDIYLPNKASCVACHSAKGGVVSTCATCHGYHNPAPGPNVASALSLRN